MFHSISLLGVPIYHAPARGFESNVPATATAWCLKEAGNWIRYSYSDPPSFVPSANDRIGLFIKTPMVQLIDVFLRNKETSEVLAAMKLQLRPSVRAYALELPPQLFPGVTWQTPIGLEVEVKIAKDLAEPVCFADYLELFKENVSPGFAMIFMGEN